MNFTYIPSLEGVSFGEHTADIWLEVMGDSIQQCITRAMEGLYYLMAREYQLSESERHSMIFKGDSIEMILIDILSEALFIFEAESSLLMARNTRAVMENGMFTVSMDFRKTRCRIADGKAGMEIKAVTFHEAELYQNGAVWKGRFLLDI